MGEGQNDGKMLSKFPSVCVIYLLSEDEKMERDRNRNRDR